MEESRQDEAQPFGPAHCDLDLPCDPSALSIARAEVRQMLQGCTLTTEQMDDVFLALGESLANAIRHGCPAAPDTGRIRLRADCDGHSITLEVTDPGPGFDPSVIPEPDVTALKDGGMGLFFMKSVMDSLEFRLDDRGNTAIMVKQFKR